jgi:hypothetical protein
MAATASAARMLRFSRIRKVTHENTAISIPGLQYQGCSHIDRPGPHDVEAFFEMTSPWMTSSVRLKEANIKTLVEAKRNEDRCKRGHPRTEANTRLYTRSNSDRQYTMCRVCASFLQRAKYRKDDAYRTAECERNRAKYYRRIEGEST